MMKLSLGIFFAATTFLFSVQAPKLPDLIVENMYLDAQCLPHAVIANIGTAGIPAAAYASNDTLVFINPFSGSFKFLKAVDVDPKKLLMVPGRPRGYRHSAATGRRLGGSFFINLNSSLNPDLVESNYDNNKFQKQLTCASLPEPGNPKLKIIDFKVVPGCNLEVQLKNIGPGNLSFDAYAHPNNKARFLSIRHWKRGSYQ